MEPSFISEQSKFCLKYMVMDCSQKPVMKMNSSVVLQLLEPVSFHIAVDVTFDAAFHAVVVKTCAC
jgi:hypothetical protein